MDQLNICIWGEALQVSNRKMPDVSDTDHMIVQPLKEILINKFRMHLVVIILQLFCNTCTDYAMMQCVDSNGCVLMCTACTLENTRFSIRSFQYGKNIVLYKIETHKHSLLMFINFLSHPYVFEPILRKEILVFREYTDHLIKNVNDMCGICCSHFMILWSVSLR